MGTEINLTVIFRTSVAINLCVFKGPPRAVLCVYERVKKTEVNAESRKQQPLLCAVYDYSAFRKTDDVR